MAIDISNYIPQFPIEPFTVVPKFSLEPNKLCLYSQVFKKGAKISKDKVQMVAKNKSSVKKSFHNFRISENAFRTMKRRINWLYYLSKSRYKKTISGKEIYNFKMAFITLTLPSKQRHNTKFITENCLNQFLTEIRQKYNMQNYVWRLEFQNNGNVHYHLVSDTYVDFFVLRGVWNRILSKHGYVQSYTAKMKSLSLKDYNNLFNKDGKTDFSIMAKRYAQGCKFNWSDPNTVDVKSVTSGKRIASYIAKYFAKDPDNYCDKNELDNEENSKSLRLWFCSRALSKLKTISNFVEAVDFDLKFILDEVAECKQLVHRYCTVIYYSFKKGVHKWRTFLEQMLRDYSKKQGYVPAI